MKAVIWEFEDGQRVIASVVKDGPYPYALKLRVYNNMEEFTTTLAFFEKDAWDVFVDEINEMLLEAVDPQDD